MRRVSLQAWLFDRDTGQAHFDKALPETADGETFDLVLDANGGVYNRAVVLARATEISLGTGGSVSTRRGHSLPAEGQRWHLNGFGFLSPSLGGGKWCAGVGPRDDCAEGSTVVLVPMNSPRAILWGVRRADGGGGHVPGWGFGTGTDATADTTAGRLARRFHRLPRSNSLSEREQAKRPSRRESHSAPRNLIRFLCDVFESLPCSTLSSCACRLLHPLQG